MSAVADLPDVAAQTAARTDPARLAALHETGLLDSEIEEAFDRLTRLAVRLVGVPASFISLVDRDRDFYKSACGFGEPLASARELTGVTFCHYTVGRTSPLVIPDTAADPLYRDVPTVRSLGVAAYVGVPLVVGGQTVGAFCTIDTKPRAWTKDEVEVLVELAASAQREMELRGAAHEARAAAAALQERTEAAEAAARAKGSFLSMMSHELRTPLMAIDGYSELMTMGLRGPVTPGQAEYIDRIRRAGRHLQTLIGEILEYSRLDGGHVQFNLEDVNVDDVTSEALELLAPQLAEKGTPFSQVKCVVRSSGDTCLARADKTKVRQILINLLTNALKFTPAGGTVSVSAEVRDGRVLISVSDSGRGIPAEDIASVFEPFVQLDRGSTPTPYQGVGLGLSICRQLARGMDGDLCVVSEVGVGSTFTVNLPAA
ncbi:MAG TPA: GAF domain-containing sensor histidine kinase [Gemmatimonadaceae bacterium]|nr:GAF domain-containing sensor histidine kinase [Gemmatimonadaceae bacterium]